MSNLRAPNIYKDICTIDLDRYISNIFRNISGKKVLDLSCGMGEKSLLLNPNENSIEQTDIEDLRKSKEFKFFLSKNNNIKANKDTYDVLVSFDVIEHVKEDIAFIEEIVRVLKPGGMAIITTPNKYRIFNVLKIISKLKPIQYPLVVGYSEGLKECIHVREYTAKELENLLIRNNIKVKHVTIDKVWFGVRIPILDIFRIPGKVPFPLNLMCQNFVLKFVKE